MLFLQVLCIMMAVAIIMIAIRVARTEKRLEEYHEMYRNASYRLSALLSHLGYEIDEWNYIEEKGYGIEHKLKKLNMVIRALYKKLGYDWCAVEKQETIMVIPSGRTKWVK